MKKLLIILFVLVLAFTIFGCRDKTNNEIIENIETENIDSDNKTEITEVNITNEVQENTEAFVFPQGIEIIGIDVSGCTVTDAHNVISEHIAEYSLKLVVNGVEFKFTADEIGLKCRRTAITNYMQAVLNGDNTQEPDFLIFDSDVITNAVSRRFNVSVYNAAVKYNSTEGSFVLSKESGGKVIDIDPVSAAAESAVLSLSPSAKVSAVVTDIEPTITADSDTAKNALAKANDYLKVALTYTFTPDNGETKTEVISKDRIATFIKFDNELNVYVSSSVIDSYASKLAEKHNVPGEPGKFVATGGYTINITVTHSGQDVNVDALSTDIYNCVSNKISGTRVAPYFAKTAAEDMSFGGNYVEVNLSAQCLWVYKEGVCVVSTPIVSGCVYNGCNTPTGVYSVNKKTTGTYLYGADYTSYVNYWVGFIGNSYGLHDATWRSEFGGDIYLYDGSHGCVNVPLGAMAAVYSNVSVGTKVILYGGASNAKPVEQKISGTNTYDVFIGDMPFTLDAKAEYDVSALTYTSSDNSVVSVSESGEVTVNGIGTATITVTSPKEAYYTAAEFIVTVNVSVGCSEGHHKFGEWTEIKAPTCAPGEATRKCEFCDVSENMSVPAVSEHTPSETHTEIDSTCAAEGKVITTCSTCSAEIVLSTIPVKEHNFGDNSENCLNGCGTSNPNYIPPDSGDDNTDGDNTGGETTVPDENVGSGDNTADEG